MTQLQEKLKDAIRTGPGTFSFCLGITAVNTALLMNGVPKYKSAYNPFYSDEEWYVSYDFDTALLIATVGTLAICLWLNSELKKPSTLK